MNQEEINAEWKQTVNGITMLVQPRHVSGLRKPYEWRCSSVASKTMVFQLRAAFGAFKEELQCSMVERKSLAFGFRLHLFALGYAPGFCSDMPGLTKDKWEEFGRFVIGTVSKTLPDAKIYMEPWTDARKFQLRFEAYVYLQSLDGRTEDAPAQ